MIEQWIQTIQTAFDKHAQDPTSSLDDAHAAFESFLNALENGTVRAAMPDENGVFQCDTRVKQLILFGFKLGHLIEEHDASFHFCDKHNLWPKADNLSERTVRIVPGGTSVRRGAYLGNNVTIMPPAYVNIGAWIGQGTMIDSHALVGSCAQVGARCHVSAAAQIGGVLEPVGALPVIIEDDCFVGGNCGIYESTHLHSGAVLAAGTILTRSTPIFDLVNNQIIRPVDGILHVPQNAVVVPGSRSIQTEFAKQYGLNAYAPLIIKYRDDKTEASLTLEKLLR